MITRHFRGLGMAAALLVTGAPAVVQADVWQPGLAQSPFGTRTSVSSNFFGGTLTDGGAGEVSSSNLYFSNPDFLSAANGLAQANLGSGTLKASSYAAVPDCHANCSPGMGMLATAAMWDTVHFARSPSGDVGSISLMPLSLSIDGHFAGDPLAHAEVRYYWGFDQDVDVNALPWISLTDPQTELFDILVVPVPGEDQGEPMFVFAELRTYAGTYGMTHNFSLADFGNTLHFNWEVPEGVIATSASGAFMTDLTSAVPEPGAWALMIVGFGLMGATLRRRREALAA